MILQDQPLHGVAVYNPDLLSRGELIKLFVARSSLLSRILDDIRREGDGSVQHHLLVGRRGMGKTMLLRRLAYAIDDTKPLASKWLPLTFPEEQYNVAYLSDFWLNCLDALCDRLERRGHDSHARKLDEQISRITGLREEKHRQRAALDLLKNTASLLKRRFLLLVDNIDLILDRVKDDEWVLRATLSSASWLLLIGGTSVGLESAYSYETAFYDFFRVHPLRGLDEEETFSLLRCLAQTFDTPNVTRVLDREPGRIRALRVLAGGNPRTLVLLFSLLAQGVDGNVRSDLERLLDHCTPLYKARFENLTVQQQQVVDAMAIHWHPILAGDLAGRLRMGVNKVSSQLNRLVRDGVVEKVDIHQSRRTGFQVAERFFNIWYLMRASRRVRRHLVWLVEFLRLMYSPTVLAAIARRHLDDRDNGGQQQRLHHAETALALASLVQDRDLRYALESEGLRTLAWDRTLRRQLADLLDLDGDDASLRDRAERMRLLAEVKETCTNSSSYPPGYNGPALWTLIGESGHLDARAKLALAGRVTNKASNPTLMKILGVLEANRRRDVLWFGEDATIIRRALRDGDCETLGDHIGLMALASREKRNSLKTVAQIVSYLVNAAESPPPKPIDGDVPLALFLKAESHARRRQWKQAESVTRHLLDVAPSLPDGWLLLSEVLLGQRRPGEARTSVDRAASLDGHTHLTWRFIGLTYRLLGHPERSAKAFENSRALYPWAEVSPHMVHPAHEPPRDLEESWIFTRGIQFATVVHGLTTHTHGVANEWDQVWQCVARMATVNDEALLHAIWPSLISIFRHAVQADKAAEAVICLDEYDLANRWRPLREALAAIDAGTRAVLTRVAPEIRDPANQLINQLAPDFPA